MMNSSKYKIILASDSPRRKELLKQAGLSFEVRKKEVDEQYPDSLKIQEIAEYLANKKADAQCHDLKEDELLLTADTIVAFEGKEFGKPSSRRHSIEMLTTLANNTHDVYTGVCLQSQLKRHSFTVKSTVKFDPISEEEAAWYYDNFDPSDKAGSYGIQDWIGYCKVEWIEGSYTNILGLPLSQTLQAITLNF